jgi:hypothetical protein
MYYDKSRKPCRKMVNRAKLKKFAKLANLVNLGANGIESDPSLILWTILQCANTNATNKNLPFLCAFDHHLLVGGSELILGCTFPYTL